MSTRPLAGYRFPALLALAMIVAGSLPYLYGYWLADEETRFMGFVGRGVFGPNGYMMLARQAQEGLHLFENRTTPLDVPRVFFNLEWWVFGKTARWTGLSLITVFHIGRAATVILFVFSAHYLTTLCLDTAFRRRLALALITLGSGFGWILWGLSRAVTAAFPATRALAHHQIFSPGEVAGFLFPMPLDVEGVNLPAYLFTQPHLMRAAACATLMCAFLIAAERSGKRVYFVWAGVAALLHVAIRPYGIPEIYLMLAIFPALLCIREKRFDWQRVLNYAIPGLMILPLAAYQVWLKHVNAFGALGPSWRPGLFVTQVLWLGLPFLLTCLCIRGVCHLRDAKESSVLMALWLALAFTIEQAYPYYRHGQEASFIAYMVVPPILAIGPLRALYYALRDSAWRKKLWSADFTSARFRTGAAVALVLFCMPSFLIAYGRMFADLRQRPAPLFISEDLYQGLQWLEKNADTHDTVLASFDTGQLVPRVAGIKSYQGHYMLTAGYREKMDLAWRFYDTAGDDAFKRKLVRDHGIHYVILGPQERVRSHFVPEQHVWLERCFQRGDVEIFRVKNV
ncbi:MAG: hypothetical protein GWP08_19685 [Nitrospiraceae bacterium]|nr:hypothetical protein [Nitrospiraceae bacterium]